MASAATLTTNNGGGGGNVGSSSNKRLKPMAALRQAEKDRKAAEEEAKKVKIKRTRQACTYCQHLKMRCSGPTEEGPCERCRRSGRECLIEERTPHRPWTKRKDAQIQQLTDRLEEMENLLRKNNASDQQQVQEIVHNPYQYPSNGTHQFIQSNGHHNVPPPPPPPMENNSDTAIFMTQIDENVFANLPQFEESHLAAPPPQAQHPINAPSTSSEISFDIDCKYVQDNHDRLPFLSSNRLSPNEAVDLFHIFMNSCAMHTVILDPEWHTIPRVGESSTFLFGVILYIASTFHRSRRSLRNELEDEMDTLIGKTITSGSKSVEVVQGFLLLYQWNLPSHNPADDRAWVLAGIGIRIATELQLHKSQGKLSKISVFNGTGTQIKQKENEREQINRERCWLMTFCVDRSLSMAVGRPWTISENVKLVQDSDGWCSSSVARSWDLGISALVSLLKLVSRQTDILNAAVFKSDENDSKMNGTNDDDFDCDTMMRIMNGELEHWRRQWCARGFFTSPVERKDASTIESPDNRSASTSTINTSTLDVHTKTLHYITKQASLRYNFAVLVLNSYGLQYCAQKPSMIQARTACITRAIQAGQSLVKAARDGLGATMTYSPHTQYTILGFGIISLIKLAPLVDEVIGDRLLNLVQNSITFLESVAIASDHTPARLASLARAMLRRHEERKVIITETIPSSSSKRKSTDQDVQSSRKRRTSKGGKNGCEDVVQNNDGGEEEDNENTQFAPNMDSYKLPLRSSRAVTPEGGHPLLGGDKESFTSSHQTISSDHEISNGIGNSSLQQQFDDPNLVPSTYFDHAETESMLQSLGLFGSIDASGYTQMTVDQILDSQFWVPLSDERNELM